MLLKFFIAQFFEVVSVKDLDHFAAEAEEPTGHSLGKYFSDVVFVGLVEQNHAHNVATVRFLVVKDIFVGGVEGFDPEDQRYELLDQEVYKH